MTLHTLKTDPIVFQASWEGKRPFEIRLNDRDYKEGDVLNLVETKHSGEDMKYTNAPLIYTGRMLSREVTYVLSGYGLQEGWVILGVKPI